MLNNPTQIDCKNFNEMTLLACLINLFQGFIDRGRNSTEWGPNDVTTDVISGETYTCETGILPGHRPTAIADLVENFEIFLSGDFTKMTHYLRNGVSNYLLTFKIKIFFIQINHQL